MENLLSMLATSVLLSSIVIVVVMTLKWAAKNSLSPMLISILWIVVLLRLIIPFSIESPVHLSDMFPKADVPAEILQTDAVTGDILNEPAVNADTTAQNYPETINTNNINLNPSDYETIGSTPTFFERTAHYIKSIDYKRLLVPLWALAGMSIIFFSIASLVIFVIKAKAHSPNDKGLMVAFKSAKMTVGLTKKVTLLVSDKIDVPITYGLLSPKILVPEKMAGAIGCDKIRLILMHELMHIKRMDILKNYLWLVAKAIHWFNPLVWIAYKRYVSDTEIICDYYVSKCLDKDERVAYTQSLLDAAKLVQENVKHSAPIMLYFCEENTKLRRRIMNILQPKKQSKRQLVIVGLITILLVMACFTTACFEPATDTGETIVVTPTPMPTATPAPQSDKSDEKEGALAYGPYWGFAGSFPVFGSENEPLIDLVIDIPVKKEQLSDYYPVLEVEIAKLDDDAIDEIADHLLGKNYTENELMGTEYVSLTSEDGAYNLSVMHEAGKYTHLRYYSEDYYYEPVEVLEIRFENTDQYNAEHSRAYELAGMFSSDYRLNKMFVGKEIPKEMANQGEIDTHQLKDCIIFRYTPMHRYTRDGFEIIKYTPSLPVLPTEERLLKMESTDYDPVNPLTTEYVDIVLVDNQIVSVTANGYTEVTKTIKYDSIISYDDAYEIFEKKVADSSIFDSELSSYYKVYITDMEFGLVKVDGQMIPAYTFTGTQYSLANGVETVDYVKTDVAAFMIISAIDGSRVIIN